ncbi:hypothetical protein BU15DRAFT_80495 [Melanogaster broomeanus]|nr:hypothetical protein BU15DRAFT_80495 [Melanogaster broomeanus]
MFSSELLIDEGSSMDIITGDHPGPVIEEPAAISLDWYYRFDHTNQTAFDLPTVAASPFESPPHSPTIDNFSLPNVDVTDLTDVTSARYISASIVGHLETQGAPSWACIILDLLNCLRNHMSISPMGPIPTDNLFNDLLNEAIDRHMTIDESLTPEHIQVVLPLAVASGHPPNVEEMTMTTATDNINFMKALTLSVRTESRQFHDDIYACTCDIIHSYDPLHIGIFPFPELCTPEFQARLREALTISTNGLPLLHQMPLAGTTPDVVWFGNTTLQTIVQRALYDPTYFGWFAFMNDNQVFSSCGVPLWVPLAKASPFQVTYTLSWIVSLSKLQIEAIADVQGHLTAYPTLPLTPTRELVAEVNANSKVLVAYISDVIMGFPGYTAQQQHEIR